MTDEQRKKIYDAGWDGYFTGKTLADCPDYPNQDEWNCAWLSAQGWEFEDPTHIYKISP